MAFKSLTSCLKDIQKQAKIEYRCIMVYQKNWEMWQKEIETEVLNIGYAVLDIPKYWTKNQLIVGEKT